ncbi:MAG: hypothetical protein QOE08_2461 [Thermoleophilaceae bacterium]|nr:hypothetical protein [Thermoleophilaceae bacterium]
MTAAVIALPWSGQNEEAMTTSGAGMATQAIKTRRFRTALRDDRREALLDSGAAFLLTRGLVLAIAVVAALVADPAGSADAIHFDDPALTQPFGHTLDALLSPLARWDSTWFLGIARDGYDGGNGAAFFPLYPLLVRVVALGSSDPRALLVAAYAVSLASFAGALYLLHRLAEVELGPSRARAAVLLLALFPGALYFGAPYSESLFLLLSVGAFYAARTGRWAWAGALAGAASGTRSAGILLLAPLVVLYLYGPRTDRAPDATDPPWWKPRHRPRRDIAWLALAPAGLAAYTLYLAVTAGDAFAYLHLQDQWFRSFAGPFAGVWDGAVAAWDGVRQLASGSREHVYFTAAANDPFVVAQRNITEFAFLLFALAGTVGVLKRLPAAYGVYVVAALALPLSFPVAPHPLMSLARFVAVLFPIFMWLAVACAGRPWRMNAAVGVSALGLGASTAFFATWHFFA